jgi:hypothetical protein
MFLVQPVWALDEMDAGNIAKMAKDTGRPVKAILTGSAAQYLRKTFQTPATIYAEATVVRKIDDKCVRMRMIFTIPDFVITVRNPANPEQQKTGPFETTTEMNFCE